MGSERGAGSPAGASKPNPPKKRKKKGSSLGIAVAGAATQGAPASRSRDDRGGRLTSGIAVAPKPRKPKVVKVADAPASDPGAAKRRRDAKRRSGRSGTILTTPLGDPSAPAVRRRALLGN